MKVLGLIIFMYLGLGCNAGTIPSGYVSVATYGVTGTGRDVTAALQKAANLGKPLYFPAGRYLVSKPIRTTGKISWLGAGNTTIILCDDVVLKADNANNATVDNMRFQNITMPWVVVRDEAWLGGKYRLLKSNTQGYQPTVNDTDIWAQLNAVQQNQDIGPKLVFNKQATGIKVSRIYGNFVSILFDEAINSSVSNCSFKGGKNVFAAIRFANLGSYKGTGNKAVNNTITYASYCGITFIGNTNGVASGNKISGCGESGIKLYQGEIGGRDARCAQMLIANNTCSYNVYDGFDLTTNNPRTADANTRHTITGNQSLNNGGAGIYTDGSGNEISGNVISNNGGSGIEALVTKTKFIKNKITDNNARNTPTGSHEMTINGEENTIQNNIITRGKARNGYAIYATGSNKVLNNTAKGVGFFFGVPGKVKSSILNNILQ